jgi:uncharacterized protein with GYD domain
MLYVTLMKFTEQGIKNVKGTVERTQQNRKLMEAAEGRCSPSCGRRSLRPCGHFEWPDDDSAMSFLIQLGMAGNVTTETLRGFNETEMQGILAKL